eukprot:TRINITY_DN2967_c0_g1_i1.p1 TRINITY_DN2967_c0_g1~~TRINITY_DN2967_c0_g1_i1.p1  ORF type:complete len:422 (+),score=91.92 TRINITY_DN2967_c0_g1_i1:119-1384(+)
MFFFFFFKQKTAYEMLRSLVGSEMCIRDRYQRRVRGCAARNMLRPAITPAIARAVSKTLRQNCAALAGVAAGAGLLSFGAYNVRCEGCNIRPPIFPRSQPQRPRTSGMKFLIAYDGSQTADEAIRYALPYLRDAEVVVYVAHAPDFSVLSSQAEAQQKLADGRAAAKKISQKAASVISSYAQANVTTVVETVPPDQSLGQAVAKRAAEQGVDCIVMGTHGYGEVQSKLLGSVSQSVLFENTRVPVLIVHEGAAAARAAHGHSVLFAVDGSELSLEAADKGAAFLTDRSKVCLFHAYRPPQQFELGPIRVDDCVEYDFSRVITNENYLQQREEQRKTRGLLKNHARERLAKASDGHLLKDEIQFISTEQDLLTGVTACMEEEHVDMVVVGSKGEAGLGRVIFGSLAHHLLHQQRPFALLVTH